MPTPEDFTGSAFYLESVSPLGPAQLRLRYTQDPKTVDATTVDDALNETNYDLIGSDGNYVTHVGNVDDDPQAVDLFLAAPLEPGAWIVAVSNVKSDTGTSLVPPTSLSFTATTPVPQALLSGGALSDDAYAVIRKHFNPGLRGPNWTALLQAIATGDQKNWDNARAAFDQLFMSTASGQYLAQRTSDFGIRQPDGVIMQDDPYRQLGLVLRNQQLTSAAIWNLLEIFYGPEAVRATIDATTAEPYELQDGDDLLIEFDRRRTISVTFHRNEFARIGQATALEIAMVVSRALSEQRQEGIAVPITQPDTGETVVRLFGGQKGLGSSVAVVGGRAQTRILFPQSLFVSTGSSPFATWDIGTSPVTPGNVRFSLVSGIYSLSLVEVGDLACIYGNEFAGSSNVGTFEIVDVGLLYSGSTLDSWFEIVNPGGGSASSVDQILFTDLMFFRPVRRGLSSGPRSVVVANTGDTVDVVLPATTLAVTRGPGLAAYPPSRTAIQLTGLTRSAGVVTATTAAPHGMHVDDQVIVDGSAPTGAPPPITAGTPSGNFSSNVANGTTDESLSSTASEAHTFEAVNHKVVRLPEGFLLVVGGSTQTNPSTLTALTAPVLLEIVSETDSLTLGRQQAYRWTNLASHTYHVGHRDFAASVLQDGRALVTGGTDGDDVTGPALATWDLLTYTRVPVQDTQVNGALPAARSAHAQASLQDGRAIVFGGWTTPATPIATAVALDPVALTWSSVGAMKQARMRHEAVVLRDGRVLAIGGQDGTSAINTCEIFTPGVDTWSRTGSMTSARYGTGHVLLPDGRVLVVGGVGRNPTRPDSDTPLSSCEVFDPATGWWSPASPMAAARVSPVVEYLSGRGVIVVAGGGQSKIEILDVGTMTWSRSVATLANALTGTAGGRVGLDTIAVVGGLSGTASAKLNYLYVPGQERVSSGGVNGFARITAATTNTFTYDTGPRGFADTYTATDATSASATPIAATAAVTPGPFVFDRDSVSVTGTSANLTGSLQAGQQYSSIPVDATAFPDELGYVVLNFGAGDVVGPLRYFGRESSTQLSVDASFVFPHDVDVGATVTLLHGRGAFAPDPATHPGNFFLTGSAAGRVAAEAEIEDVVAAGVQLVEKVEYPGDRGLGNEGLPTSGVPKIADTVEVWGGDNLDSELAAARAEKT